MTTLLRLDRDIFLSLVIYYPVLSQSIIATLIKRLKNTNQRTLENPLA